jgi:hypothetical protein
MPRAQHAQDVETLDMTADASEAAAAGPVRLVLHGQDTLEVNPRFYDNCYRDSLILNDYSYAYGRAYVQPEVRRVGQSAWSLAGVRFRRHFLRNEERLKAHREELAALLGNEHGWAMVRPVELYSGAGSVRTREEGAFLAYNPSKNLLKLVLRGSQISHNDNFRDYGMPDWRGNLKTESVQVKDFAAKLAGLPERAERHTRVRNFKIRFLRGAKRGWAKLYRFFGQRDFQNSARAERIDARIAYEEFKTQQDEDFRAALQYGYERSAFQTGAFPEDMEFQFSYMTNVLSMMPSLEAALNELVEAFPNIGQDVRGRMLTVDFNGHSKGSGLAQFAGLALGDTILKHLGLEGQRERLRFFGVSTPRLVDNSEETRQACYRIIDEDNMISQQAAREFVRFGDPDLSKRPLGHVVQDEPRAAWDRLGRIQDEHANDANARFFRRSLTKLVYLGVHFGDIVDKLKGVARAATFTSEGSEIRRAKMNEFLS